MSCTKNAGWQRKQLGFNSFHYLLYWEAKDWNSKGNASFSGLSCKVLGVFLSEATVWVSYRRSIRWSNDRKTFMGMRQRLHVNVLLIQALCRPWKLRAGWGEWEENAVTFKPDRHSWIHKGIFFLLKAIRFSEVFIPPNASLPWDYINYVAGYYNSKVNFGAARSGAGK